MSWAGDVSVINGNCVYLNDWESANNFGPFQRSNQTDDVHLDDENVLKQYWDCDSETSTSVNDTWLSKIDLSVCVYPTDACNECDFIKNATKQQKHLYIIFNITSQPRQTNFCGGKKARKNLFDVRKINIFFYLWHTSSIGILWLVSIQQTHLSRNVNTLESWRIWKEKNEMQTNE